MQVPPILYMQRIIFIFNTYLIITHNLNDCLTQLKQALEENICLKNKNEEQFFNFHFIYIKIYKIIVAMHTVMTMRKLPEFKKNKKGI